MEELTLQDRSEELVVSGRSSIRRRSSRYKSKRCSSKKKSSEKKKKKEVEVGIKTSSWNFSDKIEA